MKASRKAPQLKGLGFKSSFVVHQAAGRAMTLSAVLLAKSLELAAMLTGK
ncbi:hypothetical protein [Pseudomonas asplenii]|uniref:Uncharacterized protein n=1 Tax=Pseudomonas asplenii TaxID=53407 RepID=A0A1H6NMQ5_9PSED|nr:hypothetical protein [Pseudomonas fuscovaginae]SEI17071.1 hypothetical protein SAMN05216581_3300 [Pseudomonas fuscovaginae]